MRRVLVLAVVASCAPAPARPAPRVAAPPPPPPMAAQPTGAPSWIGMRLEPGTVRVVQVIDDAPAARAGVHVGDEVMSLDGGAIATADQVIQRIAATKPGTNVMVGLSRGGKQVSLTIQPEVRPDASALVRQSLVDKPAPAFEVPIISGTASGKLADHAGHVVVVEMWATWCGPCAITMPRLNAWQAKYAARGLVVLGLSDEEPDAIKKYAADNQVQYTLARDVDSKVSARYLKLGIPELVVISKTGVVRYAVVGAGDLDRVEAIVENLLLE